MYEISLFIHSYLRWALLILGLAVTVQAVLGWRAGTLVGALQNKLQVAFIIALDIQLLLGFLLYFALSPITQAAFGDMGATMGDSVARFWAVEHVFEMVIAVAAAHIGRSLSKRRPEKRQKIMGIAMIVWGVVTLAAIPWPFMPAGRGLFFGM